MSQRPEKLVGPDPEFGQDLEVGQNLEIGQDPQSGPSQESGTEPLVAIVIPVQGPVRIEQVPTRSPERLQAYQSWVGGLVEVVDLDDPQASMYCNEEGKNLSMPMNARATRLLWLHNPAFRQQDVICGPAFIVGPADDEGEDTTAPTELVELIATEGLLQTQMAIAGRTWQTPDAVREDGFVDEEQDDEPLRWHLDGYHPGWVSACAAALREEMDGRRARVVATVDRDTLGTWLRLAAAALDEQEPHQGKMPRILGCRRVEDLAQQILTFPVEAGNAYTVRDLCLFNATGDGQRWLAFRYGVAINVPGIRQLIHDGSFAIVVGRMLAAPRARWNAGRF